MKKKMSNKVFISIWASVLGFILALVIIATSLCSTLFYGVLTTFFEGGEKVKQGNGEVHYKKTAKDHDDAIAQSQKLIKDIQSEGSVLLKNDGLLPMKGSKKVTLFGYDAIDFMYGGGGSGTLSGGFNRKNLKEGLEASGFTVNDQVWNRLTGLKSKYNRSESAIGQLAGNVEIPASEYASVRSSYANFSDAAIVVFGRSGAEGQDLNRGSSSQKHFLELTDDEAGVLQEACNNFINVIVIINSAATLELGFLNDYSQIKAALYVGFTGDTGLEVIGDILNGKITPSGHTVDTFAYDLTTAPSFVNSVNKYDSYNGSNEFNSSFIEYEEGIYVGYRWYETADSTGFWDSDYAKNKWGIENGYKDVVQFPFGFGLSYTSFEWSNPVWTVGEQGGEIKVTLDVKNTGTEKGKDVVQLYYSAHYDPAEGIEKSSVVLGGFAKTPELTPGESKPVTIKMNFDDLASYDYKAEKAYVLSAGDYTLSLRTDAHKVKSGADMTKEFTVDNKIVYKGKNKRANDLKIAENLFDEVSAHTQTYLSRSDFAGTMPSAPEDADKVATQGIIDGVKVFTYDTYKNAKTPTTGANNKVYLIDLRDKPYDDPLWDTYLDQFSASQLDNLVSTGGYKTIGVSALGKPPTTDPDGPAGFSAFFTNAIYGAGFCSEVVTAATWNVELAEEMGRHIGEEGLQGGYHGWYAPGVNIHRSPFGGRNFEYYSEDSLISGKMGSAVVKGCAEKGVYCYIKHFAVNDQETDRNGLLTWVNEQAMREIYFKPFELAVKEGKTTAIMSSFNRLGTVWAGGNYNLLTEVLRNEWGFKGMVVTDYNAGSYMDTNQMLSAGGDLMMDTIGKHPANTSNPETIAAMRQGAKNILYTVVHSHAMNGIESGVGIKTVTPTWVIVMIVIDIVAIAGVGVGAFFVIRRVLKNKNIDLQNN